MRPCPRAVAGLAVLHLTACAAAPGAPGAEIPIDVHSFANPRQVRVTFLDLDLRPDFGTRQLHGRVDLYLERTDPQAPLVLDSQGLLVDEVTGPGGSTRAWEIGTRDPILGAPITIRLQPGDAWVRIRYRTGPDAAALQWLAPEQTSGGAHPFLYTQGQAILTRSWIPLQDSPGVRVTYQARVRAPDGLVAVMSAETRTRGPDGSFSFAMSHSIPPYLIALACGDLQRRDISNRCAVWAEPGVIGRAAAELSDTDAMLQACEELFGPYRWGRYDVLILPPAFPFGGMENPCLTFATPTILAGDKSLVSLIAHELAHSWSGNLVTNATWGDFWLNEGFATYLERRIMERVYGRARAEMEILLGLQDLQQELERLPAADQVLHIDLGGRNPDDGMTAVPYEKGAALLRRLEVVYGRTALDRYLIDYFDRHAFSSLTTDGFLWDFERHLGRDLAGQRDRVDLYEWVRDPGLPDDAGRPDSAAFDRVDRQLAAFLGGAAAVDLDTDGWITQQWLRFLGGLPRQSESRMAELDQAFQLTRSGNAEILAAWLRLSIASDYQPAMPYLREFLGRVGRRKFLAPLFEELARTDSGRAMALEMYEAFRPRYHAVATRTLDRILGWSR